MVCAVCKSAPDADRISDTSLSGLSQTLMGPTTVLLREPKQQQWASARHLPIVSSSSRDEILSGQVTWKAKQCLRLKLPQITDALPQFTIMRIWRGFVDRTHQVWLRAQESLTIYLRNGWGFDLSHGLDMCCYLDSTDTPKGLRCPKMVTRILFGYLWASCNAAN